MRSIKLSTAIAATATLLVLGPASAWARRPPGHKHASPIGNCRIDLFAEPHTVTSGEAIEVFGQLVCPGASSQGQTVTIYGRSVGSPGLKVLSTPTTVAGGFYSFVESDVTTDSYFYASTAGARSATKTVRVAPVVTLGGPPETLPLFTGLSNRVTFSGSVNPADKGAEVALQRENSASSEEWHVIQLGEVGAGGAYSITHTFGVPGDANLRVVVRAHRKFSVRGISNTLSYGISQKQLPGLSINTTSYSIAYGSPVTISGTLAGGAGKMVTLETRTPGKEFEKVTSVQAGSGGDYKFVTMPLQNVTYRVTGGTRNSAVLFEGVKYGLTAGISGTTVQSGQSLTFAGTVTPANVGKAVYIERENHFGGGFHVVDVGTVAPGGTYSIADFIFGSGKAVFRVKVPGDPDNQATFSALFPVEVTAGPPSALKPVIPPNVPSEGTI